MFLKIRYGQFRSWTVIKISFVYCCLSFIKTIKVSLDFFIWFRFLKIYHSYFSFKFYLKTFLIIHWTILHIGLAYITKSSLENVFISMQRHLTAKMRTTYTRNRPGWFFKKEKMGFLKSRFVCIWLNLITRNFSICQSRFLTAVFS